MDLMLAPRAQLIKKTAGWRLAHFSALLRGDYKLSDERNEAKPTLREEDCAEGVIATIRDRRNAK